MIKVFLFSFSILLINSSILVGQQSDAQDYNLVSEQLLQALIDNHPTDDYVKIIESTTLDDLVDFLDTDDKRFAFWINIYNSYIILVLQENPELYEDRRAFFKAPYITVGGKTVSFADIEHGIIRRSAWDLGLGLIGKPFPGKWEKKLRVSDKNYRIHFALNCGAKACPPVTVYDPINLHKQLDYMSTAYLKANTVYDESSNKVTTTPLFSWFRGDFGCKRGVKKILLAQNLIPSTKVNIDYKSYDWTLDINNAIKTPYKR